MNEQDLKLQALERTGGDIDKAKAIYAWLTEVTAAPPAPAPEPAPTPSGIVLTDTEVLTISADDLAKLAMKRLADKQNDPSRIKTPDEDKTEADSGAAVKVQA